MRDPFAAGQRDPAEARKQPPRPPGAPGVAGPERLAVEARLFEHLEPAGTEQLPVAGTIGEPPLRDAAGPVEPEQRPPWMQQRQAEVGGGGGQEVARAPPPNRRPTP